MALLLLLAVAGCANQAKPAAKPGPPSPTPTPSRAAPALVQIENAPDSRPHSGLQKADLVYEYLTEGGITRFSAIYFDPSGGEKIGPVRSARLVTLKLLDSYRAVLFYSGASDHVAGLVYQRGKPNYTDQSAPQRFSRDPGRQAPHNLYTTADQLKAGVDASKMRVSYPPPVPGEPAGQGDPVSKLSFQQTVAHPVTFAYSAPDRAYTYTTDTGLETDTSNGNQPLKITNVVLIQVAHHGAGYVEDVNNQEGIDFDLQGTGPGDLYTRGMHYAVTWDLSTPTLPLRIEGADGKDFQMPQGLTWICLVDPGTKPQTS